MFKLPKNNGRTCAYNTGRMDLDHKRIGIALIITGCIIGRTPSRVTHYYGSLFYKKM